MKTLSVEIERSQTLRFFVSVPDHWTRIQARLALTDAVIKEITEDSDDFDWEFNGTDFKAEAIYEMTDADQIDFAFPDEPAPPHPDQLPLTTVESWHEPV